MTYNELTVSVWQRGDQEGAQLSNVRTGQLTDEHHTSVRFVGGLDGLTPPLVDDSATGDCKVWSGEGRI